MDESNKSDDMSFDVNNISPEIQKYIDQQVNNGVTTGRKNAEEKLKADPNFLSNVEKQIRERIESEAKLNAEEKAKVILEEAQKTSRETMLRNNKADARDLFSEAGITKEKYLSFIDLLVAEDNSKTIDNVKNFIANYTKSINDEVSKQIEKELSKTIKPNVQGNAENFKEPDKLERKDYNYTELEAIKISDPDKYALIMGKKK